MSLHDWREGVRYELYEGLVGLGEGFEGDGKGC